MKKLSMLLAVAAVLYAVVTSRRARSRRDDSSRTGRDGFARHDLEVAEDLSSLDELRVDVPVDELEVASDVYARTEDEILDEDLANEEGQTWLEHLEQTAGENGPRPERALDMREDFDPVPRTDRDVPVADLGVAGPRGA